MQLKLYYISRYKFKFGPINYKVIKLNKVFNICFYIYNTLHNYLQSCILHNTYIYLYVNNPIDNLLNVCYFLKNSAFLSCNQLMDMTAVDRLELPLVNNKRFEFIYVFLSTNYNVRICVKGFIGMFESLESMTNLFNSSNWLEREIWDLFGIFFHNHPNLRRILTDYSFLGHPFRKDFPITGYTEFRYDGITKTIVMEPLELSQEFRFFQLQTPWRVSDR